MNDDDLPVGAVALVDTVATLTRDVEQAQAERDRANTLLEDALAVGRQANDTNERLIRMLRRERDDARRMLAEASEELLQLRECVEPPDEGASPWPTESIPVAQDQIAAEVDTLAQTPESPFSPEFQRNLVLEELLSEARNRVWNVEQNVGLWRNRHLRAALHDLRRTLDES
jgi:hypothetical protein